MMIYTCIISKINFSSSFVRSHTLHRSPDQGGSSLLACEECWPSSSSGMHQGRRYVDETLDRLGTIAAQKVNAAIQDFELTQVRAKLSRFRSLFLSVLALAQVFDLIGSNI